MKNEDVIAVDIVENGNGRFAIIAGGVNHGSYSRRRDAIRAAGRKGLTVED